MSVFVRPRDVVNLTLFLKSTKLLLLLLQKQDFKQRKNAILLRVREGEICVSAFGNIRQQNFQENRVRVFQNGAKL